MAVGVSTGGVQAVQKLLSCFPAESPGIVIVQHMPPDFTGAFARRLNDDARIAVEVAEAKHHEPIRPGRALVIPGDVHGLVRRTGSGFRVDLVEGRRFAATGRASRSSSALPPRPSAPTPPA